MEKKGLVVVGAAEALARLLSPLLRQKLVNAALPKAPSPSPSFTFSGRGLPSRFVLPHFQGMIDGGPSELIITRAKHAKRPQTSKQKQLFTSDRDNLLLRVKQEKYSL